MATFPIYGQMDKETKAGAIAKTITVNTLNGENITSNYMSTTLGVGAAAQATFDTNILVAGSGASWSAMRLLSGVAPTAPINGDIWFDGTNLKMRIAGVTKTFTLA